MDAVTICSRFDALAMQRKQNEQTLQWIERYVCPFRGKFFRPQTSEQEVEWSQRLIFDSTAIDAAQTLAASLHGAVTNPTFQWFGITFRDTGMNENKEAAVWIEECADITYQALKDSNFELEINEHYLDLVSYGTASLIEEIDHGPDGEWLGLNFQATPLRETFFEEDHKGKPLRFYRLLQWQALQIIDKFGRENVPQRVIEKADSLAGLDEKMDLIFCVYERKEAANADVSKTLAPGKRPFGFKYILKEGKEQLGDEGGYYEMPAFMTRWLKVSGSRWGHSPSHIVLPTILQLNQVLEIFTVAAEKSLDPPMASEQRNIVGDLNLNASDLTVVRDIDKLKALVPETRMEMVQFEIQILRDMIRSAFHVDQLELKESPAMTATEVMARVDLVNRLLGPTMGRLQSDLFDPLIQRTFNILWREGRLPQPPQSVTEGNQQMDIQYQGPLARSQKTDETAQLEGFVRGAVELAQTDPTVLDSIDMDAYLREIGKFRQIPAGILRDPAEVEKIRGERAAMQQARQMAEMAQQGGDAMKSLGEGTQALSEAGGEGAEVTDIAEAA